MNAIKASYEVAPEESYLDFYLFNLDPSPKNISAYAIDQTQITYGKPVKGGAKPTPETQSSQMSNCVCPYVKPTLFALDVAKNIVILCVCGWGRKILNYKPKIPGIYKRDLTATVTLGVIGY